jgi:cytidine deaminase
VGAALETADGRLVSGCNIENASYGLTMCAERVAMFKALSEGHRAFVRIAIVADTELPTPPCGACRQILWEFAGDIEIVLANRHRVAATHQMSELLPHAFDGKFLP